MTFKEELKADIDNVFLNLDDFGEDHTIEGKPLICMFDDDELKERQGTNDLAVSESSQILFAKEQDLPKRKVAGDKLVIDGKVYVVDDWKVNLGMIEAALHCAESH